MGEPAVIADGDLTPAADGALYAEAADQWAAGQPEVREARDEQSAALALYELALDFQDRSQRTEAGLIEQFENAAGGLLGMVGTLVIVDDDDEHLSLEVGGFRGRVIAEGEEGWTDISSPDQIVRFYDPTDVFGDLAEAIVDTYPSVTSDAQKGEADAADEDDAAGEDDAEDDDEVDEAEDGADGATGPTEDDAEDDSGNGSNGARP